jgi:hypothetical protein
MYEVLAGRPPFKGKDHKDTLSQIIERNPAELRKVNKRVPRDLDTIVLKCLRKEARDRFATAEALAQDLRRFVREEPIEARPQGRCEKTLRQLVRSRRQVLTGAVVLCSLLVCGVLSYRLSQSEKVVQQLTRGEQPFGGQFHDVKPVEGVNSPAYGDFAPVPSANGLELFFASDRPGGQGNADIWVVSRGSPLDAWGEPRNITELNTESKELPTWLSPDGRTLYYQRGDHPGGTCAFRESGSPYAIWTRVPHGGAELPDEGRDVCITGDECEMFFIVERPEGKGRADIWKRTRHDKRASWGDPQPVEEINTRQQETWPCISADGLVVFLCRFSGDILWAERGSREEAFGPVRLLGPPVNSEDGLWEGHFRVTADWPKPGSLAYFMRGSGRASFDIYQATWRPAPAALPGEEKTEMKKRRS